MNATSPRPASPGIVAPAPDAFVLPFNRLRPGFDPEQLPRFRDLAWRLALISPGSRTARWSSTGAAVPPGCGPA
ncbi:hypothetical protein ABZX62_32470 [Streptomyces flavidovirens]|uniref:hypothetical protein n=1 Tax=Streptomyces flavidovirens TaxID=67298 RepID=UPI0033B03B9C